MAAESTTYQLGINREMLTKQPGLQSKKALEYLILNQFPKSDRFNMRPTLTWVDDKLFTLQWNRKLTIKCVKERLKNLPFVNTKVEYQEERTPEEEAYLNALADLH